MTTNIIRDTEHIQRVQSEKNGLLYDVSTLKASLPGNTAISHHVQQFEDLCNWILGSTRLSALYDSGHWNLERPTFDSLIISLLSGKWVSLRQVALQRAADSPYLKTLGELDDIAAGFYQRLLSAMRDTCELKSLSASSPLAYLGPIARMFVFEEKAPCLISTPFGAANGGDAKGQELCRQTIPHEVSHAIFEQIPGLIDELKFKTALSLAKSNASAKQRCMHPTLLGWMDEIIADMAGTALAGEPFAHSASIIMIMPEQNVGLTDDVHPIPLIRPFIHAWTLRKIQTRRKLSTASASKFEAFLEDMTGDHLGEQFVSLPATVTVTMSEVRDELYKLTGLIWDTNLEALNNHSLGAVFSAANTAEVSPVAVQDLPAWGTPEKSENEFIFKPGGETPGSPMPGSSLFVDWACCTLLIQSCCSRPLNN